MALYLTKYEGTFREEAIKMQLDICSFTLLSSLFPNHLQRSKAERAKSWQRQSGAFQAENLCSVGCGDNVTSGNGTHAPKWFCQHSFCHCYCEVKHNDHKLEAWEKDDLILVLSWSQNSIMAEVFTEQGLWKYASHMK